MSFIRASKLYVLHNVISRIGYQLRGASLPLYCHPLHGLFSLHIEKAIDYKNSEPLKFGRQGPSISRNLC